jgi:hypothetical protein
MTDLGGGDGGGFLALARASFMRLGVEPDETRLAIMAAADTLYQPLLRALMEADLQHVPPEIEADLSRPPS